VYPQEWSFILIRSIAILVCTATLAACTTAAVAQVSSGNPVSVSIKGGPDVPVATKSTKAAAPVASSKPLLPDTFAGWVASDHADSLKPVTDPALADGANAAALKEYGFTDAMAATYKRGVDTLTLHALRFHDVSGSYGAYSFYRQNAWPKVEIGDGATSNKDRVLFWKGTTVVDATFSPHVGPMSASELRELASQLPAAAGTNALPPPILADLPQASLDKQTTHYALGPLGYAGAGVLPADLIGFDRGAETVTANYTLRSGPATLTIIDYPTPQMASAQEARLREYIKAGPQAQLPWPKLLMDSDRSSLEVRRSGPLLALVSGDAIPEESHKLLGMVHYDADLTAIPQPTDSEVAKTGRLLLGIATLVVIGCSAALLLGFFLGGGRALYRMARGKPISSVYEAEFIRLNLSD
jgi:hypothetical protein